MVSLYPQQVQDDLFSLDVAIDQLLSSKNPIRIRPREWFGRPGPLWTAYVHHPLPNKKMRILPLEFFH